MIKNPQERNKNMLRTLLNEHHMEQQLSVKINDGQNIEWNETPLSSHF